MFFPQRSLFSFLFSRPGDIIHAHSLFFQEESKFRGFTSERGHIKGPGEQGEWEAQGPGQGVLHFLDMHVIHVYIQRGWQIFLNTFASISSDT